jgi:hypothetical protein
MTDRIKKYLTDEQIKKYYNVMEDSTIKAEYIIWDNIDFINNKYNNISELEGYNKYNNISELESYMKFKGIKNYNYGDLVAFSTYRDTGTYFIGKNGKLISNPDTSAAGYLTIPFEITQYLNDATSKYNFIDDITDFELRYDDKLILNKIGKVDPEWNFKYSYIPDDEELYVIFPKTGFNTKGHSFDINDTTPEDIYKFYEGSKKEQGKIKIYYELTGNKYDEFKQKYSSCSKTPNIPKTWSIEHGSGGGGHKKSHGNLYFNGPIDEIVEVMNSINSFYQGFNYTIT